MYIPIYSNPPHDPLSARDLTIDIIMSGRKEDGFDKKTVDAVSIRILVLELEKGNSWYRSAEGFSLDLGYFRASVQIKRTV